MPDRFFQLFQDQKYDEARAVLLAQETRENRQLLSLLYRYLNRYKDELELVDLALRDDPSWPYMMARKKWHDLPIEQKTHPRSPLLLSRNPADIPETDTIQNMCFVTGGDSNYFQLMLECIQSLRATRHYIDVPIHVVDCGLKPEQREILIPELQGGSIRDPGWPCKFSEFHVLDKKTNEPHALEELPARFKAIAGKAYLDQLFPGYSQYFWINANSWVQDERAIDAYLKLCERQKLVFPDPSHGNARPLKYLPENRIQYIPEKYAEAALSVRHGCDAVFCIDARLLPRCREILEDFVRLNGGVYFYYFFEFVQSVLKFELNIEPDPPTKYYAHFSHLTAKTVGYKPMVFEESPHVLYSQHNPNHPIGILRPVSLTDYEDRLFVQNPDNEIIGEAIGSTHFRTYPWKEKPMLRSVLLGECPMPSN